MSHVLSDLSRLPELYFGLIAFISILAVLAEEKKARRAMAVLRLLLRKRRP
jgi:hypothetical protein